MRISHKDLPARALKAIPARPRSFVDEFEFLRLPSGQIEAYYAGDYMGTWLKGPKWENLKVGGGRDPKRTSRARITPTELSVLDVLAFSPEKEIWIMDLGVTRESVRRLAALKLVKIRPAKDGRGRPGFGYVSLTTAGAALQKIPSGGRDPGKGNIAGAYGKGKRPAADKYNVVRYSGMTGKAERVVSGPHSWPLAWRKAAKLNDEAREAFREGRHTYDTPEFKAEKIG